MADYRKQDPRKMSIGPDTGGSQTVGGGGNNSKVAAKDSLIGKNSCVEYKPGKLPQGSGALGGKNASV